MPVVGYWDLEGTAEFNDGNHIIKEPAIITAYLDNGVWFFTPTVMEQYGYRSLTPPGI